jgi:hypothetical protein
VGGTQHRRTEFDFATTGYGLVNVDSASEHALLGREFSFDLGIQNLLNKRLQELSLPPQGVRARSGHQRALPRFDRHLTPWGRRAA